MCFSLFHILITLHFSKYSGKKADLENTKKTGIGIGNFPLTQVLLEVLSDVVNIHR